MPCRAVERRNIELVDRVGQRVGGRNSNCGVEQDEVPDPIGLHASQAEGDRTAEPPRDAGHEGRRRTPSTNVDDLVHHADRGHDAEHGGEYQTQRLGGRHRGTIAAWRRRSLTPDGGHFPRVEPLT
jgi:hypothetical protein